MENNQELERIEKIGSIAKDILKYSRNQLIVNLRFMNQAISRLEPLMLQGFNNVSTDGVHIGYDPIHILESYKACKELPVRKYLHMVLHCVFRHFLVNTLVDQELWGLACDMAVENIINGLMLSAITVPVCNEQASIIENLEGKVKYYTAEVIYDYLINANISSKDIKKMRRVFFMDDHSVWYTGNTSLTQMSNNGDNSDSSNSSNSSNGSTNKDENEGKYSANSNRKFLENDWKAVSEKMQMDIETFSKGKLAGKEAGALNQNLREVNREKYDYSEFLKKFAVMGEVMQINDDEFDYIFYTYGMNMYGKMPLIEPLEYKEVKRVKEFVIAIDTSESTSGDLVQKFLNKTYNIMKQEENFFTKINVHIIQCDTEIQEHVKISSQEEFDEYINNMTIRGLGGTDFRPVFGFIDELIERKEFKNLKGMIYFTDGFGEFPIKQPDYETAVVYIDDEYNNPDVPVWAIKLVLKSEEILY